METALVVANVALVLITLCYVILTGRMVNEMKLTRLLAITPRVVLGVHNLGAGLAFITVANLGKGPAINVKARLAFGDDLDDREVGFHVLAEGAVEQFMTPSTAGGELMRMDELTEVISAVTLRGTMEDALGNVLQIDEQIAIAEVWEITKASHRHLQPDQVKRLADELSKVREQLEALRRTADRVTWRA